MQLFELPIEFSNGLLFIKINFNFYCREKKSYNNRQIFLQPFFLNYNSTKVYLLVFGNLVRQICQSGLERNNNSSAYFSKFKPYFQHIVQTDHFWVMFVNETIIQGMHFNAALNSRSSSNTCQSWKCKFYLIK